MSDSHALGQPGDSGNTGVSQRAVGPRRRRILLVVLGALATAALYVAGYSLLRTKLRTTNDEYAIEVPGGPLVRSVFMPAVWAESWLDHVDGPQDAELILNHALTKARLEDKRVLLVIGTTHCLPCRQLDALFDDISQTLTKHFIVAKINDDVMRHGESVHMRFRTVDDRRGMYVPWMVVLDDSGEPLITSDGPKGVVALPQGSDESRAYFIQMLRETASGITDSELWEIDRQAKAMHGRLWNR